MDRVVPVAPTRLFKPEAWSYSFCLLLSQTRQQWRSKEDNGSLLFVRMDNFNLDSTMSWQPISING